MARIVRILLPLSRNITSPLSVCTMQKKKKRKNIALRRSEYSYYKRRDRGYKEIYNLSVVYVFSFSIGSS